MLLNVEPIFYKNINKANQTNFFFTKVLYKTYVTRKPVLPYANNKGADQPAHPRSLISAFVIRCLDSIIPLVSISKISSL